MASYLFLEKKLKALLPLLFLTLASSAAAQMMQPVDENTLVSRGGASLTLEDLDARMAEIPQEMRVEFLSNGERVEKMLRELLAVKQLAAEARRDGVPKLPEYAGRLKLSEERLLATMQLDLLEKNGDVGDVKAMALERYTVNKNQYQTGPKKKVAVLEIANANKTSSKEEIKNDAEKLKSQLKREGQEDRELTELTEQESLSKKLTVLNDLTLVAEKTQLEKMAYSLESIGEIEGPFDVDGKVYLLQLEAISPSGIRPFDEVKEFIENSIEKEMRAKLRQNKFTELNNMEIFPNGELIGTLSKRYQ